MERRSKGTSSVLIQMLVRERNRSSQMLVRERNRSSQSDACQREEFRGRGKLDSFSAEFSFVVNSINFVVV